MQIFCKDLASERNESLLSNCRAQQIFCKDTLNICNLQTFMLFFYCIIHTFLESSLQGNLFSLKGKYKYAMVEAARGAN